MTLLYAYMTAFAVAVLNTALFIHQTKEERHEKNDSPYADWLDSAPDELLL